jgi:hypothetical protein
VSTLTVDCGASDDVGACRSDAIAVGLFVLVALIVAAEQRVVVPMFGDDSLRDEDPGLGTSRLFRRAPRSLDEPRCAF